MLHIIFAILKIVLLILAAVLGIALWILALLLLIPVRYEAHIKKKEEFFVEAKVHWLLHLVRVPVSFRDGKLSAKLKVLIFTVKDFLADEEEIQDGAEEAFPDVEEASDAAGQVTDPNKNQIGTALDKTEFSEEETYIEPAEEKTEEPDSDPARKQQKPFGVLRKITVFLKMLVDFLKATWRFLSSIPKKLKKLKYTFHQFYVKIKRMKRFATDDRTRAALGLAWSQLRVLLGKLLPKRVWGDLHFGTDDPALTGEILGGISIFYPLFMDNVKVVPDFQESVLEGELYLKGRIRLITIVRIAWKLYRDKNVRFVYRMVT